MSEEIKDQETVEEVETEQVDTQEETEPTVTVKEMQRRLGKEKQKQDEQADEIAELSKQLEELQKQQMSPKELTEWEKAKHEDDLKKKDDEIRELNRRLEEQTQLNLKRDLRDKAITELNSRGMEINDAILSFVVKDSAEDTLEAITAMEKLLKNKRKEEANTGSPVVSGGSTQHMSTEDIFAKAKITGF